MAGGDFELQLQADCDSFKEIVAGLDRLEQQLGDAQAGVAARGRGYFTPDEDDLVRQMLLAYRSYRFGIYEIISRYLDYEQITTPALQLRSFMMGFAAALTLYAKSLKLIQTYEHEPLVRQKLNEPDAKFELEAGFFDGVLRGFSSLSNYRLLAKANWFWRRHRKDLHKFGLAAAPDWEWLAGVIRHQRIIVQKRLLSVLGYRLRYDWRIFWQTTFKPVKQTRYSVQSLIAGRFAQLRTTVRYQPAINETILTALRPTLLPGDVLLVRAEHKLTGTLLPGFWAHAAIYVGSRRELRALGLEFHPHVQKHWPAIPEDGGPFGQVIEAISPRAVISPLEKSLFADHVAVLRPNVSLWDRTAALAEAFAHLGKPYDFEFDFNVTSRIVCTELIYRCYHGRACIQFPLVKRLGRFTLSGSDIVSLFLTSITPDERCAPFRLVNLVLKTDEQAHFVPPQEAVRMLREIQSGKRPGRDPQ